MISNSNSTKKLTNSKTKKDNKADVYESAKNNKKSSSTDHLPAPNTAAATTTSTAADFKTKKDNKADVYESAKNNNNILPLKVDDLNNDKKDNKEKVQLSYYEKQVLKELKGIRKASKNILKTIKKFNN